MKKFIAFGAGLVMTVALSSGVMASSKIGKTHTKPGKDGAKINCNYCHKDAGIAKKKGATGQAGNAYCAIDGCHK